MSDFEPIDDELASALRRRTGSVDTSGLATAAAHDAVLARARGVRRRRAGIVGGATMAVLIAGGVLLLDGGEGDDTLAPATGPTTAETTSVEPQTSLAPTSTISVSPSSVPAVAPTTTAGTPATTVPATAPPAQPTVAPTNPPATQPPATETTVPTTTAAPTPPPTTTTETYNSSGGSITVTFNGSALGLQSVNPAAGHESEIEDNTPSRIRVRFRGPSESRIEVRIENGVPVVDID